VKIGSLCSGYGGLDMAVEAYYNAETVWMCDIDKYSSIVIKERWRLPNLGDLKTVDWAAVEPIDILTAGYPCQPFSQAGLRKGLDDERHIWPYIKEIISTLQPKRVILENVRGHLTLGFKEVLKDLTEIGYDAKWAIVRASDVGAPHQRARLFVIAYPISERCENQLSGKESDEFIQSVVTNSDSTPYQQSRRTNRPISQSTSQIVNGSNRNEYGSGVEDVQRSNSDGIGRSMGRQETQQYQRQSQFIANPLESDIFLREIPNPLAEGKLNAKFVEYMMGLPVGWVTDLDISRSQQLKLLGNGVVPQQAYYAIDKLERL
jgi:DNA (cytosine-5)-methyltransferase 1